MELRGFTEAGAHGGGDCAEGLEDVLLVGGLGLLAGDVVAAAGVLGGYGDEVVVAELGDGAGEVCLDAFTLADLASDSRGEGVVFGFAEVLHGLADVLLADEVENGGLLKLDGEVPE